MLRIFAKLNTSEKVAIICRQSDIPAVQGALIKKHGGNWLFVDTVIADKNEVIYFDDGLIYQGFEGSNGPERYCKGIKILQD